MRSNTNLLLMIATAAGCIGAMGGVLIDRPAEAAASVEPARVAAMPAAAAAPPVPSMQPVLTAARAVLGTAGIESAAENTQVGKALAALSGSVRKQSDPGALKMAFKAYFNYKAANPEKVRKPYLYFVDYGLDSRTPRGYVFDMEALKVVDGPFTVAHGRGSDTRSVGKPTRFSNREGSNATSLGLYLTQETYAFSGKSGGKAYRSVGLRMTGLSGRFNSAARERRVVVHGAPYVTPQKAGRSEGCPAMETRRASSLLPRIGNGGLVFLFSPLEKTWMSEDPWANRDSNG
ncbi:MAG TPA: murein L,D-transpeptidase catalytic domain family protein [Longimicrobium sp.]|nr:murein L,D-transpeptidase catalytic domain family protein [Longimicrobium sp.]